MNAIHMVSVMMVWQVGNRSCGGRAIQFFLLYLVCCYEVISIVMMSFSPLPTARGDVASRVMRAIMRYLYYVICIALLFFCHFRGKVH